MDYLMNAISELIFPQECEYPSEQDFLMGMSIVNHFKNQQDFFNNFLMALHIDRVNDRLQKKI